MDHPLDLFKGRVFLSGTLEKQYTWESISPQQIVVHIYSGELVLTYGKSTLTFFPGDTVLIPKNRLTRSLKRPAKNKPFKCVSLFLPEIDLKEFYHNHTFSEQWTDSIWKQRPINPHPLLNRYFETLLPYFDIQDDLPKEVVSIKIKEALTVIDKVDKKVSAILGDFKKEGKIDLKKYMEDHFMYNVPLERFASLTGRSLTTFKTDFKEIFNTTPRKWLTDQRLKMAYDKIVNEKIKTTDVYLTAGFENLSHFSFAFKKAFGQSPRNMHKNQLRNDLN